MSRADDWLRYAEEDYSAATDLLGAHNEIALFHAHQAAEKGLKALYIHRHGENLRTHDLVRLYGVLNVPGEFQSVLEDLNPADTAVRYPDAGSIDIENPSGVVSMVGELLAWIRERSNE